MKKILSLALAGVLCLGFAACGEEKHEHEFSAWIATENGHERVCDCGEKESGEHIFEGGVCKICNSTEPKKEEPDNKEPDDESGDKTPDDTNPDDESDNKESDESTESEASRALTEEEWRAALAEEKFDNFSFERVSLLSQPSVSDYFFFKFADGKCYFYTDFDDDCGEGIVFFNGTSYVEYWKSNESDEWTILKDLDQEEAAFGMEIQYSFAKLLKDCYDDFEYDDERDEYFTENKEFFIPDLISSVCDVKIKFHSMKLASIYLIAEWGDWYEFTFFDYGTTVVELPEIE